jgi:hypothetical protein
MKTSRFDAATNNPAVEAYIGKLLDRSAALRLPDLFGSEHPEALYRVRDRHGISVIALYTPRLSDDQLRGILLYRLVQYMLADQLDPKLIFEHGLECEPASNVSPRDIHVVAGTQAGEILCYFTIECLSQAPEGATLGATQRPLFPVEKVFGHGVYGRTRVLPDLLVKRVRELGRFAKNHQYDSLNELIIRGPVELSLAVLRLLSGSLMQEIDACVGDIEVRVVKKNLDFFHVPTVLVRGVVPYASEGSFGFYNYQNRTRYPFAFLCSDISKTRLDAIERALEQPANQGVMALLALRSERLTVRSRLEPAEGLAPLADAEVPQEGVAMAVRRQELDLGDWLRTTSFFETLSVAEAAVLGTFLERRSVATGETIIRQGGTGDDLYLIESGEAEVVVTNRSGHRVTVKTLGPGDCFGEIAVVTGGERTADVISATPMALLRLSQDAYARYLANLVDVERRVTRTALARAQETLRVVRRSDE